MTNKEAIEYLKEVQSHIDLENGGYTQEMYDAIDMAIGKLQANDEQVILTHNKELKSIKSEDYRRAFTEVVCGDCKYADVPRNRKPCCSCCWLERESYYEEAEDD